MMQRSRFGAAFPDASDQERPLAPGHVVAVASADAPSVASVVASVVASAPGRRARTRRSALVMLVACTLALLCAAGPALAGPSALVVYGKADKRLRGIVFGEVERVLREAGWQLIAPFSEAEVEVVSGCMSTAVPWTCMRVVVASRKTIDRVIAVRVEVEPVSGAQSQVVLTGQLVQATLSSKLEQTRYCGACSDAELRAYAVEVSKLLLDERAVLAGTTRLEVKSEPMGAEVLIDGKVVGITNNAFPTTPGEHTVEVRMKGYAPETRKAAAVDGKTVSTSVTLRPPTDLGSPSEQAPGSSGLLPKVMVGVGVAAIVAGGVVFALDEDKTIFETKAEKDADPTYREWALPGIATMAAGAVITGVGGYLWWRSGSSATKPTVATTAQGVTLGLAGTF